jgi:hypothetical protein
MEAFGSAPPYLLATWYNHPVITIEFSPPRVSTCECCGAEVTRLTRFVHKDGDAHAVYYALFSEAHSEGVVDAVVSLGEWGDGATPAQRRAFPLELWIDEQEYRVTVTSSDTSPWQGVDLVGEVLDREEALKHPWIQEVYHITNHIFAEDEPVKGYLDRASQPKN